MKIIISSFVLLFSLNSGWSQLSFHPMFMDGQLDVKITGVQEHQRVMEIKTIGAGVAYWFRIKEKRIEFHPEIYFQKDINSSIGTKDWTSYGFSAHTQIYPFDFGSDCQCPTFSKQGEFLKKGFYFFINPGMGHLQLIQENDTESMNEGSWGIVTGGGIGFDFGLGNVVTFSPMIGYSYQFFDQSSLFNHISAWQASVRIFFRWDSENFYRRR